MVRSLGEQSENLGSGPGSEMKYPRHQTIQRFSFFIYKMGCLDLMISQFLQGMIFYNYVVIEMNLFTSI